MGRARQVRQLAMQLLYQLDARGEADGEQVKDALAGAEADAALRDQAWELAQAAWARHAEADALSTELAPAWPPHRQPPVDRSILRLAYHEMAEQRVPVPVAINEAIELAKEFGTERSAAFVNGVLDKMARRMRDSQES